MKLILHNENLAGVCQSPVEAALPAPLFSEAYHPCHSWRQFLHGQFGNFWVQLIFTLVYSAFLYLTRQTGLSSSRREYLCGQTGSKTAIYLGDDRQAQISKKAEVRVMSSADTGVVWHLLFCKPSFFLQQPYFSQDNRLLLLLTISTRCLACSAWYVRTHCFLSRCLRLNLPPQG